MRNLTRDEREFIYFNYNVSGHGVYHFSTYVCSYVYVTDKVTLESYTAFGKDNDEAMYNLFHLLPDSSIREGQVIVDDQKNHWIVTWDCGEKVQLKKREIGQDDLEENIMVYIYKGLESMSIGYRKHDRQGNRVLDISKNIPEHIEKVAYKIMVKSTIRQKNQELLLKIPKRLIEKYGDLDE